ncbi:MAG: hypothetical protein Q4A42_04990 [Tissierellia bacterium]|nr:hypothetical protein [Tissierellia bacterium]
MKKNIKKIIIIIIVAIVISIITILSIQIKESKRNKPVEKPIIYLYPEKEEKISVNLDYNGKLTHIYPKFSKENEWTITAKPDGTIIKDNKEYYALFWEGEDNFNYKIDKGFCIKGEDTAQFLEEKLEILGLNQKEINEFIIYWLPKMENNNYNVISFQTNDYTNNAKLNINPKPDTLIRVFMTWYPSKNTVEISKQNLIKTTRTGFTVVEWGGSKIK